MLLLTVQNEGQTNLQVESQICFQQRFGVFGGHESMSSSHEMNKVAWSSSITSLSTFIHMIFRVPLLSI
jgi:hypothetical protein